MSRKPAKKKARPLAELVSGVMSPIVARRAAMSMELLGAWPELAGPAYAHTTRPQCIKWPRRASDNDPFEPGTLIVACDGGSAIRIQHEADAIVERVNVFLGFHAVARLKIVQRPVRSISRSGHPGDPGLDPEDRRALDRVLGRIEDPQLRARLEKLGRGVISRARKRD